MVKVCTVNVGTLKGKSREVVDMLNRRGVDICCLQETRYRNQGCTVFGKNDDKYKFWYSGSDDGVGGVGIMVKSIMTESVIEVVRFSDRVIKLTLVLGGDLWHIFSVYAPQVGRSAQEKQAFWDSLEDEVGRIPDGEGLLIGGDMNGHIGRDITGYDEEIGLYGYGDRNEEGEMVLNMCKNHGLRVLNTLFRKEREKLITYKSGQAETQIDLILMRDKRGAKVSDCCVIPGEACLTQHRLVRAKINIRNHSKFKVHVQKRIKMWKLKDPELRERYERKLAEYLDTTTESSLTKLKDGIMTVGAEICGVTTGRRGRQRETWWWNPVVQSALQEKKVAFKVWQRSRNATDRVLYREKCRNAKRSVAVAKQEAWQEWSTQLNSAEGRNKMFRMAAQMRKDRQDISGTRFIKGNDGNIVVDETEVRKRWKDYFDTLLNEEYPNFFEEVEQVEGPIEDFTLAEIQNAVKAMKNKKAPGPSGLSSEMLKLGGETCLNELHRIFQQIVLTERCPTEWQDSETVVLFKGKGDPLDCSKYRGLRLLEHSMKIFEKLLDDKIRRIMKISNCQFGFRKGKSCNDAIFITRTLQAKYLEKKRKLHHVFIDLEKAFDRIPRKAIAWALRRQGVPERLIRLVMMLYNGSKSRIRVAGGLSDVFEIGVGVHQGSVLSPLLFIIIMEEATKSCASGGPWELLYADDLVLTAESKSELEQKFRAWKSHMEGRGLKVNVAKTKYLITGDEEAEPVEMGRYPCGVCGRGVGVNSRLCIRCQKWCHKRCSGLRSLTAVEDFICPSCSRVRPVGGTVDLVVDDEVVERVKDFRYLGDVLGSEGGSDRALKSRTRAAWSKWKEISGLLLNKGIPLKSRASVYAACIRSVLLYGTETWSFTKRQEELIRSCDRRFLRYMAGVRLSDRTPSEEIGRWCGLEQLDIEIRRRRLRWFGHVKRREVGDCLGDVLRMEVSGSRPRGRPKKSWMDNVKEDLRKLNLREDDAYDRDYWRAVIKRQTP